MAKCSNCGREVSWWRRDLHTGVCEKCKNTPNGASAVRTVTPQPNETVYLEKAEAFVSNARAVLNKTTYAMANITSVRTHRIEPNLLGAILIIMVGAAIGLGGCFGLDIENHKVAVMVIGFLIVAFGIVLANQEKPTFVVVLATSGGETHAMSSTDPNNVQEIVDAMTTAIIGRG